jgi:hypothetical protein
LRARRGHFFINRDDLLQQTISVSDTLKAELLESAA